MIFTFLKDVKKNKKDCAMKTNVTYKEQDVYHLTLQKGADF